MNRLQGLIARLLVVVTVAGVLGTVAASAASAQTTDAPAAQQYRMGAHNPTTDKPADPTRLDGPQALPASVDLSSYAVPVGNQGQVGSCVGWAVAYALLGWYSRKDGHAGQPFAPMYMYSQINRGVDNGSQPSDAFALLLNQGNARVRDYAAKMDWRTQPTSQQRTAAAGYKATGHQHLFSYRYGNGGSTASNAIKQAIASGQPVAVTMNVRAGFMNLRTGVDNDTTTAVQGAHEVVAMGYTSQGLRIQNSWGTGWGNAGYGTLSWNVGVDVTRADTISGFAGSSTTDRTPPSVTAPRHYTAPNFSTTSTSVPVTISWSASDPSGISRYALSLSTDNGQTWTNQTLASATQKSTTYALKPGTSYVFSVRATDGAGNVSSWATGKAFRPAVIEDTSAGFTTGWYRASSSSMHGGTYTYTRTSNAKTTIQFTGSNVAWVGARGTDRGVADVYVDGQFARTIDQYASSFKAQQVLFSWVWAQAGTHRIEIVSRATSGRPYTDLDAVVVL